MTDCSKCEDHLRSTLQERILRLLADVGVITTDEHRQARIDEMQSIPLERLIHYLEASAKLVNRFDVKKNQGPSWQTEGMYR